MRIIPSIRSLFFSLILLAMSAAAFAQVGIVINFGPPALPVYEQPYCPGEGYLWTPGYWAFDYDYNDYYWVPGTWVEAPEVGFLWTPGYWAWNNDRFMFSEGYWGPHVGFYGGISYGFGYSGEGYEGGRWDHDRFFYNRSVNNVNITNIHNVYNTTVINNTTVNHVSYNGGNGGISARPRSQDEVAVRERHIQPIAVQTQHVQAARAIPELRATANQGKPPIAATPKPGALNDREVVHAKEAGGRYNPPANRAAAQPNTNTPAARPENKAPENNAPRPPAIHPKDLPQHSNPTPRDAGGSNSGNNRADQKYQQQQEKLYAKQNQEHQKLQQKQDQEHQRQAQQNANDARNQQVEQRHQQQTQQMEQRHAQQQQKLQTKQPPPSRDQSRPEQEKH